jgi:hypothetical protein
VSDALEREQLAGPGWRTFQNIAAAWGLTTDQRCSVLGIDKASMDRLAGKEGAMMSDEILTRISYVFGIYKALHTLLPLPERADHWVSVPNAAAHFGGRAAIEIMTTGRIEDLAAVRAYLDAQLA